MSEDPIRFTGSPSPQPAKRGASTGESGGRSFTPAAGAGKTGDVARGRFGSSTSDGLPSPATVPDEAVIITVRSPSPEPLRGAKVPVKDDGNCLFHSLQWGLEDHQDYLHSNGLQSGRLDQKVIRKEVSDTLSTMLAGDPDGFGIQFFGILLNANEQTEGKIREYEATRDFLISERQPAALIDDLNKQITELRSQILEDPSAYASRVNSDGFWGGEAEIIAFTNRYCINVKVLEQKGDAVEDTGLPTISPAPEQLANLGINAGDVPTIYLIASKKHYDYFRPE